LLFCACNGAEWSNVRAASPYPRPTNGVNLTVASGEGDESEEMTQTLTTSLVEDLKDDGIDATVDLASPTSDQLRLEVANWNPGSQVTRYFVGMGAGEGTIVIVVDVKDVRANTIFHGRIRGYVTGGAFGGASHDAVRAAAKAIADAVATGQIN
jgi:hypothetical protein